MAISKIKTGSIEDGTLSTSDLADSSVTSAKIAANPEFSGTEAAKMPSGTTAQRANAAAGDIRFNTNLSLMEYYDGTNWKSIDSPPVISSVSGAINENTDSTLTINGSNFQSGATVYIEGAAVSNTPRALTTTVVNASQVTAATNASAVNYVGGAAYDIRVTNASGLSALSASVGAVDRDPTWTTASGNVGTVYDSTRGSVSTIATLVATDAESTSVTYAITSGSLPTGVSLNTSTGVISRTGTISAETSDTTYTFSVTPTSNGQAGVARSFNIVIKAPAIVSFTSTGSSTWTVPTGLSAVQVLMVAGGGAGGVSTVGAVNGGGGGAGGMIEMSSFPVTPGGSVSYTVGAGGPNSWFDGHPSSPAGSYPGSRPNAQGSDSVFGSLTAKGGGFGGSGNFSTDSGDALGSAGGSGGGHAGWASSTAPNASEASGTQPTQPGNSGTYGYGYPGGKGGNPSTVGGGGGGASAKGTGSIETNSAQGVGGAGRSSSISGSSVTYGGGGGAGGYPGTVAAAGAGGSGGGGAGTPGGTLSPATATPGTTNRGGGGGGCSGVSSNPGTKLYGGNGGPGIIIVKY
jgi:Putative Ig domain